MIINEIIQQFIDWTKRKIRHDCIVDNDIYFREKEIWWAALGKNIGFEMDGKHEYFTRPVIILKKFSPNMCFVLPLTSKLRQNNPSYQFILELGGRKSAVNLSQGRAISSKRLMDKAGIVDSKSYDCLLKQFIDYFTPKK